MGNACFGEHHKSGHNNTVDIKHFDIERVIGKGGFGKVNCVVKRKGDDKGMRYAMKTIWKSEAFRSKSTEDMLFNELKILNTVNHPQLVNMLYAFQDDFRCYLILDLALGGDLEYQRQQQPLGCFDEGASLFYVSQLFVALEYMHSLNILHRDIKPDNLVLEANGYIKLTDFGISKYMDERRRCSARSGTGIYMAPEITQSCAVNGKEETSHGVAADFYAMGITLYFFLTGELPMQSKRRGSSMGMEETKQDMEQETTQSIIQARINDMGKNDRVSDACKDFVLKLTDPHERVRLMLESKVCTDTYPSDDGAHDRIRLHPWFEHVDWAQLAQHTLTPPLLPDTKRANCNTGHDDASDTFLGTGEEELILPVLDEAQQKRLLTYDYNTGATGEHQPEEPAAASTDLSPGSVSGNKYKSAKVAPL